MIYLYDQALQLPTVDLYDTLMMAMALNAAKDMYEKNYEQMKDFNKEFGDFYSPISSDTDWVYNNSVKKVRDAINDMYAKGIDPLRNPQGRAMVSQIINSVPIGEINKRRQAAEAAKLYIKNRAELQSKGLWDPDMERYAMGGKSLEDWNTETDGMWTRTSPILYKSMDDIIEPIVSKINPSFDAALTAKMNDGFDYSTVSEDRIRLTIDDNMVDLIGSGTAGGYYYKKAYDAVGGDPDKAKELLKQWYVNRASNHVETKRESNPYKLDKARTANDNWLDAQKTARDRYNHLYIAGFDKNQNGKIDKDEYDAYAKAAATSKSSGGGRGTKDNVIYPYNPAIRHGKTKDKLDVYIVPAAEANEAEIYDESGNKVNFEYGESLRGKDIYFIPADDVEPGTAYQETGYKKRSGKLGEIDHHWYDEKGNRVTVRNRELGDFIYGTASYKDANGETKYILDEDGNPKVLKMRITYGKKITKG